MANKFSMKIVNKMIHRSARVISCRSSQSTLKSKCCYINIFLAVFSSSAVPEGVTFNTMDFPSGPADSSELFYSTVSSSLIISRFEAIEISTPGCVTEILAPLLYVASAGTETNSSYLVRF